MTDKTDNNEMENPRGGGDVSGKSATPVERGGGDVSGKTIPPDEDSEETEKYGELRKSAKS